jgi:malate dehydrogenase (oxaloacetate-decarboxylating)
VVGAGSAGCGIAALLLREMIDAGLSPGEARARFYAVDRDGLLVEGMPGILDFQKPFAQPAAAVAEWSRKTPGQTGLLDMVQNAKPTVLIGVSAQAGLFSEAVVRAMAASVPRPIIFPLSNPTSQAEATPQDLMAWTEGRAIIGTGSPFPPIERDGKPFTVDQTNNAYVSPSPSPKPWRSPRGRRGSVRPSTMGRSKAASPARCGIPSIDPTARLSERC